MNKRKYWWLAVTADEYELPLAVMETAKDLADLYGLDKATICSAILRGSSGSQTGRKFVKVLREGLE